VSREMHELEEKSDALAKNKGAELERLLPRIALAAVAASLCGRDPPKELDALMTSISPGPLLP